MEKRVYVHTFTKGSNFFSKGVETVEESDTKIKRRKVKTEMKQWWVGVRGVRSKTGKMK